jgi:hypothetical protein
MSTGFMLMGGSYTAAVLERLCILHPTKPMRMSAAIARPTKRSSGGDSPPPPALSPVLFSRDDGDAGVGVTAEGSKRGVVVMVTVRADVGVAGAADCVGAGAAVGAVGAVVGCSAGAVVDRKGDGPAVGAVGEVFGCRVGAVVDRKGDGPAVGAVGEVFGCRVGAVVPQDTLLWRIAYPRLRLHRHAYLEAPVPNSGAPVVRSAEQ